MTPLFKSTRPNSVYVFREKQQQQTNTMGFDFSEDVSEGWIIVIYFCATLSVIATTACFFLLLAAIKSIHTYKRMSAFGSHWQGWLSGDVMNTEMYVPDPKNRQQYYPLSYVDKDGKVTFKVVTGRSTHKASKVYRLIGEEHWFSLTRFRKKMDAFEFLAPLI